jgi:hypothetical protein
LRELSLLKRAFLIEGRPTPWRREGFSDLALTRSRSDRQRRDIAALTQPSRKS